MSEIENFIKTNSKDLHKWAFKFTKNDIDAEDIAQDTIVKMLSNKHRFRKGTNIKAWAYIILKNTFISFYGKSKRRQGQNIMSENISGCDDEDHQDFLPGYSQQNGAIKSLELEEIQKYVAYLKEDQKKLLNLYLKGLKYEELSEIFETPMGSIKNRIFMIKQTLKEKIQSEDQEFYDIMCA